MIAASIVGVLCAAGLLVAGLIRDSALFYYSSIAASVLAAFALLIGVRGLPVAQLGEDDFDIGHVGADAGRRPRPDRAVARVAQAADGAGTAPAAFDLDGLDERPDDGGVDGQVPDDEPPPEVATPAQDRAVARLVAEVCVIDGRPRYHLAGCLHLLGRTVEPLPVLEAVELGFTPCGQCAPVATLLAERA